MYWQLSCKIVGILMLHMFVYKCWDAQNKRVSIATKIVIGMIFACIAMFLAGSVEIARQKGCNHLNNSKEICQPLYLLLTPDLLSSPRQQYFQSIGIRPNSSVHEYGSF